jgi:hypothetical protein
MAVLIEDVFPAGVTIELLDAVTDEMGVDGNLPAGGVMHAHFEREGRAHGVDVWDSVEAYDSFVRQRSCQPWARLLRREASTRQRWANPR